MTRAPELLIVTADDFGLATEINEAVETAHQSGILSAASLMVGGSAAEDAIDRARRMPSLRVGLHLVLVEGRPVLPPERIPDLVNSSGYLRSDMVRVAFEIAAQPAVSRQASAEIAAQFEAFRATGLPLDHVNAHKHFHLHPVIAAKAISIGMRHGMRALRVPLEPPEVLRRLETQNRSFSALLIPLWAKWLQAQARRTHLIAAEAVFGLKWSGAMTMKRLEGLINNLPRGAVEVYTHPATSNRFVGHAAAYSYVEELAALTSQSAIEALRRSGRRLGGYSDIGHEDPWTSTAQRRQF